MRLMVSVCTLVLMTWGTMAAAITDAEKCEAAKLKTAGKYSFCRLKAEAKAAKTGDPVDYTKCDNTFGIKWGTAEMNGGGMCPTNGDGAAIQTSISQHTDDLAAALAGAPLPDCATALACGNGAIDSGEDCDQANLNGKTCVTQGFAGGTLACGAACTFDTGTCSSMRFVDNGNGTVTDVQTGLMWEKKTNDSSVHDKDNYYTWSVAFAAPDGLAFTTFLAVLNNDWSADGTTINGCFVGQCDWRLPTIAELQTILLEPYPCGTNPCIDPIFGPAQSDSYWSATTAGNVLNAWYVLFTDGNVNFFPKNFSAYIRAVRGGS